MHEMALVSKVVDIVLEKARVAGVQEVKAVNLAVGEARDIVDELMTGVFDYLARGTVAERAVLTIDRIPTTVECNQCGTVFPMGFHGEASCLCPGCGSERNYHLLTGMEFMIKSIEVANEVCPEADAYAAARMRAAQAQDAWAKAAREAMVAC